jgi:hypothetical protein
MHHLSIRSSHFEPIRDHQVRVVFGKAPGDLNNTLRGELFALAPDVAPQLFLAPDCISCDPVLMQEQSVFALQNISCLSPLTAKKDE